MTTSIIATIAAFFLLAYFGAPILWWTAAAAALLWTLSVVAGLGFTTKVVLAAVFVLVAAVLNLPLIRRKAFTHHVPALYRRILPDMSQTEKEALHARTGRWEADLFSCRPGWDNLL